MRRGLYIYVYIYIPSIYIILIYTQVRSDGKNRSVYCFFDTGIMLLVKIIISFAVRVFIDNNYRVAAAPYNII